MSRSSVRSRLFGVALAFGAPLAAGAILAPFSYSFSYSLAFAGDSAKPAEKKASPGASDAASPERYDPDNVTAISQYMESLVKAVEKLHAKDLTAAVDGIKKAIQLSPRHPLGHYLLGETYLALGNLSEAEAAFLSAQERADSKNQALRSHVLFAVADVYEREKKWEQAKTAWHAYAEHAAKIGQDGGAFPQTSAERIKALQKIVELEKAYAPVRERIAAEKHAAADAGKPPTKK